MTLAATSQAQDLSFSWPSYPTLSYATPVSKAALVPTYAPSFRDLASLLKNGTTTTWASISSPTDFDAKYGNVAWSSAWASFNISTPLITTTVSPTPVPNSELVKPTPLPFPSRDAQTDCYKFPLGFISGFTGAALQIEGAVKSEGRGPSYTELLLRPREEMAKGGGKPDITNLNYYLYKQDIARLAAVGVKSYAFSISWSRILPFGIPGSPVNQEAIDHYDDVINTVLEYGLTPIVTLHHFDTPISLATNTSYQCVLLKVLSLQARILMYSVEAGTTLTLSEVSSTMPRLFLLTMQIGLVLGSRLTNQISMLVSLITGPRGTTLSWPTQKLYIGIGKSSMALGSSA